jgi:transcriptional regulator with XRE-family HTH domain
MRRTFKINHLPTKLRAVRKCLGLSQSQLAAKLRLNPHYGRISEFERGRRIPNLITLLDYARLAGIHVDDLVDDQIEIKLPKD